ncbi:MAG: UPF0175 family protein [Bacteroidota bacterium]
MPTLNLPDLPASIDEARARLLLAIRLFQEDEVSVGRAARIAGLPYRAFLDALRERGIPAFVYDDVEAFERELQTVRAWAAERGAEHEAE